jgi:predicted nucleotidyltransferase
MEFAPLLTSLTANNVRFVIIGGLAATLHGSARVTYDIDVVYDRSPANLDRIVTALAPMQPYLRGAPPGLPFRFDAETLKRGLNFTLTTTQGPIDLLGEVSGVGSYETVRAHAVEATMFGVQCLFIDLDTLLVAKKAAGRPKDLETIAELEAIREERKPKQ